MVEIKDVTIIEDTREQRPLYKTGSVRKKLDTGDYSFIYKDIDYSDRFAIERKSIADLFGTLTGGHDRFKRELSRSQALDYFCIVIDGTWENCMKKKFDGSWYIKTPGHVIISILETIHQKYGINYIFSGGRVASRQVINEKIKAFIKIEEKRVKDGV